jgi:hypothetical protein
MINPIHLGLAVGLLILAAIGVWQRDRDKAQEDQYVDARDRQ